MDFIPEEINAYVIAHSQPEPELLQQLSRETWQTVLAPRMLSGHLQGRILSMLSKLIHPEHILEIGTYTGYSALCLVEGLTPGGELHTIDNNEELIDIQRRYFDKSGYGKQIIQHTGDALKIIPKLERPFDLVFIDADKENYRNYYELALDKMPIGGYIIADNVLWTGKVLTKPEKTDTETQAIRQFNDFVQNDVRVENVMLPVRDGLMIMRKKE